MIPLKLTRMPGNQIQQTISDLIGWYYANFLPDRCSHCDRIAFWAPLRSWKWQRRVDRWEKKFRAFNPDSTLNRDDIESLESSVYAAYTRGDLQGIRDDMASTNVFNLDGMRRYHEDPNVPLLARRYEEIKAELEAQRLAAGWDEATYGPFDKWRLFHEHGMAWFMTCQEAKEWPAIVEAPYEPRTLTGSSREEIEAYFLGMFEPKDEPAPDTRTSTEMLADRIRDNAINTAKIEAKAKAEAAPKKKRVRKPKVTVQ
jgi:hypothetical protein